MLQRMLAHEAARVLGITPAAVRDMERRGDLRAQRVGGIRLFARRDVERLAAEREQRRREREQRAVAVK